LKKLFPGTKFKIHSSNYSNGDSVRVSFIDGPPGREVEEKIQKYQRGSFNSMEDIYELDNRRDDIPQTKYLFVDRKLSPEALERFAAEIRKDFGIPDSVTVDDYLPQVIPGWKNGFDRIYQQIHRQYSNVNTNTPPHKCDNCPEVNRELNTRPDGKVVCDRCAYQLSKLDPPEPSTAIACGYPGCALTDKGHIYLGADHAFQAFKLQVLQGGKS
jgi:hypothetical protein